MFWHTYTHVHTGNDCVWEKEKDNKPIYVRQQLREIVEGYVVQLLQVMRTCLENKHLHFLL